MTVQSVNELIESVVDGAFDIEEIRNKYRAERDKRLRPEGNEQYVRVTAEFSHFAQDPYVEKVVDREPLSDEVEVAVIGAGFGGLLLGARLREAGVEGIRLIEDASDVGGTWYWNRYPGAACDVESYIYLPLLEETGYVPVDRYSKGPEIFEHCRRIARTFDLYRDAVFNTRVTEVRWDGEMWVISTNRGDRMRAKYVAMANGRLSKPKLPGIPGINEFEGHTFHTSRWDYGYTGGHSKGELTNLADKRVGIIGTGATAIQAVPHLGQWAKQLFVFQRTPSSVDVRNNQPTTSEFLESLEPGWQRRRIENFNTLVSGGDAEEDLVADGWTDIFRNLTGVAARQVSRELGRRLTPDEKERLQEAFDARKMEQVRARIDALVEDPATAESLKPWYRQFCKRPCFHDEYLPTFNLPNVSLVDTEGQGVTRLTKNGVVVGDTEYELDCLVFATGFEVGTEYTSRVGYDVFGKNGVSLSDHWKDGVRTHHGFTMNGFPNCFLLGFAQTATTVNIPHALDEQASHVAFIIAEAERQAIAAIEASAEAEDAWITEMRDKARLAEKFFAECTPGYYNNEGITGNKNSYFANTYGAGPLKFFEILEQWRASSHMEGLELLPLIAVGGEDPSADVSELTSVE
jgi:cyclohexanone monooxygenase